MAQVEYTILQLASRINHNGYSAAAVQAAEGVLRRLRKPGYTINGRDELDGFVQNPNALFDGAVVFDPLTIDNGEDSLFLDGAVFGISPGKNLVKTKLQGRQGGTVKELIGNDDTTINVTGIFARPADVFPYEEVETLFRMFQAESTVEVTNELLNRIGITTCVFDGRPSLAGSEVVNIQEYSFQLITDEPIELNLS